MASISRLLQIIGLFCKRAPQKRLYSARDRTCRKRIRIYIQCHMHPCIHISIHTLIPTYTHTQVGMKVCRNEGRDECGTACIGIFICPSCNGVATVSRIDYIIGPFCRILSLL